MRYRIVNRRRFITFCTVVLLMISLAILPLVRPVTALGSIKPYTEITVSEGDTLWEIAKEFGPDNMDIREVVFQTEKINGMDSANIFPGQVLLIPCE